MDAYLRAYINYKEDSWARLLPIAESAYKNTQNTSISYISFELNYAFHFRACYKKDVYPYYKSKSGNKRVAVLYQLMSKCKENLSYTQDL